MRPFLRTVALSALKIAVIPMAFVGFMMWASMTGDAAATWYGAAAAAAVYALCFVFIALVQLSARTPRAPAPVRFVPARTMDLAALLLLVLVAIALFSIASHVGAAFGWWR